VAKKESRTRLIVLKDKNSLHPTAFSWELVFVTTEGMMKGCWEGERRGGGEVFIRN